MDTQVEPRTKSEPELNLLLKDSTLQQPLWISLFQNLNDFFLLKKLPPLVLTSKPVPLRTILGLATRKKSLLGSTVVHVAALMAIIGLTVLTRELCSRRKLCTQP